MKQTTPTMLADATLGNMNGWQQRHNAAVRVKRPDDLESTIVAMLASWAGYAEAHRRQFDSLIGKDGFLGPHWEAVGDNLSGLLNGDTGPRLDRGTLDKFIHATMAANGVDVEHK